MSDRIFERWFFGGLFLFLSVTTGLMAYGALNRNDPDMAGGAVVGGAILLFVTPIFIIILCETEKKHRAYVKRRAAVLARRDARRLARHA